jgi:chorismate mutase-like protein
MQFVKIILISFSFLTVSNLQAECLAFKPVFELMRKRAMLLKDVAANKYKLKQNVFDASQELKVLQRVGSQAGNSGLEKYSLMQYAQLQMDLARHIEQYWLNSWQNNPQLAPKTGQYQDLAHLRQQIQVLDQQIYPHLAQSIKSNTCTNIEVQDEFATSFKLVQGIPVSPDFTKLMVNAILTIKLRPAKGN